MNRLAGWEFNGESAWKRGDFEIYEVDADGGRVKVYELCGGDEYLGTFRTRQMAVEFADARDARRES